MSKNRTWVNKGSHFNPMGRPQNRNEQRRDNDVIIVDGGGNRRNESQYDKLTTKVLNMYLEKKWNAEARMLDLSGLVDSDDLAELSPNLNTRGFCEKLARCIANGKAWCQSLDSINLAHNSITNLKHIAMALNASQVKILNLALSNNQITNLKDVDFLIDLQLREVIFAGNPIASRGDEYHQYVVKKLRTIELLDTVSVKEWRKQLLPKLPEPRDSQMTNETNTALVVAICQMFFKCIDEKNFDALLDVYDNDAFFSYIFETGKIQKAHHPSPVKNYHQWLDRYSHNIRLLRVNNSKECTANVFRGRQAIVALLNRTVYGKAKTTHDVSTLKADAIGMGPTVVVTIHGIMHYRFFDDTVYRMAFDRVFILRPNKAGTEWPARIANDQLIFREEQDAPILMPEVDIKAKLMAATGLNDAFATLLLRESNNNYDQALQLFTTNKAQGSIPAEAFAAVKPG